ncbi:MAG: DNA polymerase III subunit beta [Planctomycetes bacterium]|nr:DNA polymerase III subunit beta [Planctomycetota bacterium]
MKAVVGWEAFRDALHLITQLVPGRANLGEPSAVQITTTGDAVVLSSQDYDCAVRIELTEDIDPKETGSITLPGQLLTSFVRDLRGKTLELRTKPNSDACSLSCGGDTLELVAAPEQNFDPLPEIDPKGTFEVPTEIFAKLIDRCSFAVAKDDRRGLHGLRMEVESDRIRIVATDSRRLAIAESPLDHAPKHLAPTTLPTRTVSQLVSAIRGQKPTLRISPMTSQICFSTPGLTVFTRVIQAKFPEKYAAIVPSETSNSVRFRADDMAQKLRLVANVSQQELRSVELRLSSNSATLVSVSPGQGTATAEVPVTFQGVVDRLKYNPDYLIEGLKRADTDEIELVYEQANTPAKFLLGEGFIYVVMPINV